MSDYKVGFSVRNVTELNFSQPNPLLATFLSVWSSTCGPSTIHLWKPSKTKERTSPHPELLSSLGKAALSGELMSPSSFTSDVKMKVFQLNDQGFIFMSFVYSALPIQSLSEFPSISPNNSINKTIFKSRRSTSVDHSFHSFGLLFDIKQLDRCIAWQNLIENFMKSRLMYLKIQHEKTFLENVIQEYSSLIEPFAHLIYRLYKYGLQPTICVKETVFQSEFRIDPSFLEQAIGSHLMTFGRTVVIGCNYERVNMMIKTLALFLSSERRQQCVLLDETERDVFSADLLIQGYKLDEQSAVDLSVWDVMNSPYPLTVVDLRQKRIYQSYRYSEHLWRQHVMHQKLLRQLYNADKFIQMKLLVLSLDVELGSVLVDGCYKQYMVSLLLNQILHLCNCDQVASFIRLFFQSLRNKANLLVDYCREKRKYENGEWYIDESRLRETLDLQAEGDFLISLACGEMICPGLYTLLCGDSPLRASENLTSVMKSV